MAKRANQESPEQNVYTSNIFFFFLDTLQFSYKKSKTREAGLGLPN